MFYLKLSLGKSRWFYSHRLVAECFIVNEHNLPEVDHIDGNKLNNTVDNLRYITHQDNIRHGKAIKEHGKYVTPVGVFPNATRAANITGIDRHVLINWCKSNYKDFSFIPTR